MGYHSCMVGAYTYTHTHTQTHTQVTKSKGRMAKKGTFIHPVHNKISLSLSHTHTQGGCCDCGDLEAWKQQVVDFYPAADELLAEITSFDEITFATYRNVRMKSVVDRRVVFIGDAAHATSPHLGQGANLALVDAVCLADQLSANPDYSTAFARYRDARRSTTNYYSKLTGILTPFFQTQSRIQQFGRNLVLPVMPKLPFVGKQMALTMAGLKSGWFRFRDDSRATNS